MQAITSNAFKMADTNLFDFILLILKYLNLSIRRCALLSASPSAGSG
jgi:hypothetical protein